MSRVPRALPAAVVALGLTALPAAGQQTRAESIAEAQAAKATQLKPYVPSRGEQLALGVKKRFLENPDGLYPYFDSVYSGGGFTLGAGYRKFYGDRTFLEARGLLSAKAYKLVELATESIGIANGVDFRATGGWRDATQVAYYGMGGDSSVEAISNFRLKQAFVGGVLDARGPATTVFKAAVSYEDFTLENGTGASAVIGDVYTKETAPGLGDNPAFLRTILTGGFDTRPSPGYARRGGLYTLSYESYVDTEDTYTFDGLQAEVVQHLPILRENWVVSLHGVARTTLDDGDTVPYFLLPSLGSGSTLRGYSSWRFRDRHSLLLSGEWRWIPNRMFLDMAIFYDAGKVTSRLEDINFDGLKQDVGIGFRIHGPLTTPLRIELARGSEGLNLVFSGAAAF